MWKIPTQDRPATNSISTPPAPPRHPTAPSPSPHPPYPPPFHAISTKSHFLCLSNRYWLKITRTSRQVLISPQEHIQDPWMTTKNLSSWRRHEDSLQQCVADQTPPLMCSDKRSTVPPVDAPTEETTITEKSHYQFAMKEVNLHQEQDGLPKNFQETSLQIQWRLLQYWYNLFI